MPLVEISLPEATTPLPSEIAAFLAEVNDRIDHFMRSHPTWGSGFVPSDFVTVYHALRTISDSHLTTGRHLCEWGSGFGIVAMLAEMLGFRACGIEIDQALVEQAHALAGDREFEAEFVHGSFIPRGSEACAEEAYADNDAGASGLVTETDDAYTNSGSIPTTSTSFCVSLAGAKRRTFDRLFDRCAADGALLLTYWTMQLGAARTTEAVRAPSCRIIMLDKRK